MEFLLREGLALAGSVGAMIGSLIGLLERLLEPEDRVADDVIFAGVAAAADGVVNKLHSSAGRWMVMIAFLRSNLAYHGIRLVSSEEPVRIPAYDEPEPNITIVQGSDANSRHQIPDATDMGLLVEVSAKDATADRRQGTVYGRSGIPLLYWVVNLVNRQVEVYTDPGPAGYALRTDFASRQQVPVMIDGRQCDEIAVNDILP